MQCLQFRTHQNELEDHFNGFCLQKKIAIFTHFQEVHDLSCTVLLS